MEIEERLEICDEVYFHLIQMNFRFYKELYNTLTLERAAKAIIEAQKELLKMVREKHLDDYYKRLKDGLL